MLVILSFAILIALLVYLLYAFLKPAQPGAAPAAGGKPKPAPPVSRKTAVREMAKEALVKEEVQKELIRVRVKAVADENPALAANIIRQWLRDIPPKPVRRVLKKIRIE